MGALYFQLKSFLNDDANDHSTSNTISVTRGELDATTCYLNHRHRQSSCDGNPERCLIHEADHLVHTTGIIVGTKIVDTTGAGDAFIGGYLLATLLTQKPDRNVPFAMNFGSWVAGKKLAGPGARNSLPTGLDVDQRLGMSIDEIDEQLRSLISPFNAFDENRK